MYYAEKIINGILHYKTTPKGEWRELSKETLTTTLIKYKLALEKVRDFEEDDEYGDPSEVASEALMY